MALFRYASKLKKADEHDYLYKWDLKKSLVDEVQGVKAVFKGNNSGKMVRDSQGVHINNTYQCLYLTEIDMRKRTIELDIKEFDFKGNNDKNTSVIYFSNNGENDTGGEEPFYYKPGYGWCGYDFGADRRGYIDAERSVIDGKTIKIIFGNPSKNKVYFDDELIASTAYKVRPAPVWIYIGGVPKTSSSNYNGNSYNMTISGVRIYKNED